MAPCSYYSVPSICVHYGNIGKYFLCFKAHLLPLDWVISASAVVPAISREGFSAASLLQEPGRGAALLVVLYLQNCSPKSEVSDTASQSWVCACDRQTAVTASHEV